MKTTTNSPSRQETSPRQATSWKKLPWRRTVDRRKQGGSEMVDATMKAKPPSSVKLEGRKAVQTAEKTMSRETHSSLHKFCRLVVNKAIQKG
jgi:hypothetical protein